MKYKDLDVIITFDKEESEKHIEADYNTLINEGIDKIIK
jgi:hypothetical protein